MSVDYILLLMAGIIWYLRISETKQIVADELQRIVDDPDLYHLLPKKDE